MYPYQASKLEHLLEIGQGAPARQADAVRHQSAGVAAHASHECYARYDSAWHRQLVARKWTYAKGPRRAGVLQEIRRLVVLMAEQHPTWGYTRIAVP